MEKKINIFMCLIFIHKNDTPGHNQDVIQFFMHGQVIVMFFVVKWVYQASLTEWKRDKNKRQRRIKRFFIFYLFGWEVEWHVFDFRNQWQQRCLLDFLGKTKCGDFYMSMLEEFVSEDFMTKVRHLVLMEALWDKLEFTVIWSLDYAPRIFNPIIPL